MDAKLGIWVPLAQRRAARRRMTAIAGLSERGAEGGGGMAVIVRDLAPEGFGVDLGEPLPPGTIVWLQLPGLTGLNARIVWQEGRRHGCEFLAPISSAACDGAIRAAQAAMSG